jgi:hypothetical protein
MGDYYKDHPCHLYQAKWFQVECHHSLVRDKIKPLVAVLKAIVWKDGEEERLKRRAEIRARKEEAKKKSELDAGLPEGGKGKKKKKAKTKRKVLKKTLK